MKMAFHEVTGDIALTFKATEIPLEVFHSILHRAFSQRIGELTGHAKERAQFTAAAEVVLKSFSPKL